MNDSRIKIGPYRFNVRPNTSDEKAIQEVVVKGAYFRKDFPMKAERWVDLGANIGAFTVLAASAGIKVDAYEPDPATFELLSQNVELNGLTSKVNLFCAAVTVGKEGKQTFYRNSARGNHWRNSLVKPWRGGEEIKVEAVPLSSLAMIGADCKMDIEGSEMEILESMTAWPRRLVFEWSFDIDGSIPRFQAVIERLRGHYKQVIYRKFDESVLVWPASWFPAATMVWCQ